MAHPYPSLARLTLEKYLAGEEVEESLPLSISTEEDWWSSPAACFVSLKNRDHSLRGCIGTIFPAQANLGLEIMANAVSAATRDPRFPPLGRAELERVSLSVDVLSPPEPVNNLSDLDPKIWGVIVEKNGLRGLLLPDLEGVDTVEQQLSIAARKAGLSGTEGLTLQRFSVHRYPEERES